MKKIIGFLVLLSCCFHLAIANTRSGFKAKSTAPEPVTCVTGVFTKTGSGDWAQFTLKITNSCGKSINFQNSSITFNNNANLNTSFWGEFLPLSYPDNQLQITSQPATPGFISSFSLHFPEQPWANTILPDKGSFLIRYGASTSQTPTDVKVYINGGPPPVTTGQIELTNTTAKPAKVSQTYALVNVVLNGQTVNTVQVPWSGTFLITNLQPATYTLQPQTIMDTDQNSYEGKATPASVTVLANQKVNSTISYQQIITTGTINVKTPVVPAAISGYPNVPVITFRRSDTGATVTKSLPWNMATPVIDLANNVTYQLSTPTISYQGVTCVGTFSPVSVMSRVVDPLTSQLTYTCSSVTEVSVKINVSGLPCEARSITVTFQPSDGSAAVSKVVNITGGSGTDSLTLTDGVVYNVSSSNVTGYVPVFNPQPIMAKPEVAETITYQPVP